MKVYVIFSLDDRELLRYSLQGEADGERQATAELLAYENGVDVSEIGFAVVTR